MTVPRLHRAAAIAALAFVAAVGSARAANAANGFAMAVDVRNSQQTIVGHTDGSCTWRVTSDITLVNLTDESLTISDVADAVNWTAEDNTSGVVNDVTIVDDAGLHAGVVMGPREERTFPSAVVELVIPCKATFGDLMVRVTTPRGTSSGDAPFLENGTPVPLTAVGALGLSAILAAGFVVVQGRRRRQPAAVA
jgi:hypothetical protein